MSDESEKLPGEKNWYDTFMYKSLMVIGFCIGLINLIWAIYEGFRI